MGNRSVAKNSMLALSTLKMVKTPTLAMPSMPANSNANVRSLAYLPKTTMLADHVRQYTTISTL